MVNEFGESEVMRVSEVWAVRQHAHVKTNQICANRDCILTVRDFRSLSEVAMASTSGAAMSKAAKPAAVAISAGAIYFRALMRADAIFRNEVDG